MENDEAKLLDLFDELLNRYEASVDALDKPTDAERSLIAALLQRDRIAARLPQEDLSLKSVSRLAAADKRLQQSTQRTMGIDWTMWRQTLNPPQERWWWHLDEKQVQAEEKRRLPAVLLTGMFMALTISLAVELIRRMWISAPDQVSAVGTLLVLVISGSPLTKQGRELANWVFDLVRWPAHRRTGILLMAAFLSFAITLALRLSLPLLAITYNNMGYAKLQAGDLTDAHRYFIRAVSLDPDNAVAYYNLADAYVDVGDSEQAIVFYKQAISANRNLDLVYNGYGHALVKSGKAEWAIPMLYRGISLAEDNAVRGALWTNLGWAYLKAGRPGEARSALAQALAINPQEASTNCALGLVAEKQPQTGEMPVTYWENCLRYADYSTSQGQEMASMARAHLQQMGVK